MSALLPPGQRILLRPALFASLGAALLLGLLQATACGNAGPQGAEGPAGPAGPPGPVPDAAVTARLVVILDPSLDTDDGDAVKATALYSGSLLDPSGKTVATAAVQFGNAVFDLAGLSSGDYFVEVDFDGDDLVPVRVDDPSRDVVERVGTKLRTGFVQPYSGAGYRFTTYSAGQNEAPVVQYSDGGVLSGEQAYVLLDLADPRIEVRLLGTAALLSSYTPTEIQHPSDGEPFADWVLMGNGTTHHSDTYAADIADGGTASCVNCHTRYAIKPSTHAQVTSDNGLCFQCHYGTGGAPAGFVDPSH